MYAIFGSMGSSMTRFIYDHFRLNFSKDLRLSSAPLDSSIHHNEKDSLINIIFKATDYHKCLVLLLLTGHLNFGVISIFMSKALL